MDKRLKRQAALYMLITLVDENEGYIENNDTRIWLRFVERIRSRSGL